MKIFLLGAKGQLGTDLMKTNPGYDLWPASHADVDITDITVMGGLFHRERPQILINTAAFNKTEECEQQSVLAKMVNGAAPTALAGLCAQRGIRMVHFGSDFVFDGEKGRPYVESDPPEPLSVYGWSKRAGEEGVLRASTSHIVIRTATLFGASTSTGKGGNFVESIIAKARRGESLNVVGDIRMSPTYSMDLARRVWAIVAKKNLGGLFHVVNEGSATWFEFAQEILRQTGLSVPLKPIPSSEWAGKMNRPPNSSLVSERLGDIGLPPLRPWPDALKAYLTEKKHI